MRRRHASCVLALACIASGRDASAAPAATVAPAAAIAPASLPPGVDPAALAAIERLRAATARVHALSYRFEKEERMRDGAVERAEHLVKLERPGRFYLRMLRPAEGQEVIFDPARSPKLVAHRGHFPDITVHLGVLGSLATRGEHHPITHLGFDYLVSTLERAIGAAQRQPAGERVEQDLRCDVDRCRRRLELVAGRRAPSRVVAREGEDLFAFAERVESDPYWLLVANPDVSGMTATLEARPYVVPAYYGSRTELVLDEATSLPLEQTTWDDAGRLYEHYRFDDLVVDPPLGDFDFDPRNPAYGF